MSVLAIRVSPIPLAHISKIEDLSFGQRVAACPLEAQKTHPKMWARADTTVDEMRADIQACSRSIPEPKVAGWAMLGAALELGAVAGGGMSPGLVGSSTDSSGDRWALVQRCMADKGYTQQQ